MNVTVVTGYVRLPCTHRSADEYAALGARLLSCCPRSVAFRTPLADCWLAARIGEVEPGGKDSVAYHCVQHQKTAWLEDAAAAAPDADVLVWLDYGLLHNKNITEEHVCLFLAEVERRPPERITSPSCGVAAIQHDRTLWTFLGSLLVVPRNLAETFHDLCMVQRADKRATWEVNTWAEVHGENRDLFHLYAANHDETMLTRYAPC